MAGRALPAFRSSCLGRHPVVSGFLHEFDHLLKHAGGTQSTLGGFYVEPALEVCPDSVVGLDGCLTYHS